MKCFLDNPLNQPLYQAINKFASSTYVSSSWASSATTTIEGNQLPPPPPQFRGVIEETAKESKPWWPPRVVPPKGAPNILLIMTDDQGYGVSGTFGGVIPTPALDRIANTGLRYTEFNSTALCSPTRAALITGRNHHGVGFGVIAELSTGYPGYDSIIGPDNATIIDIKRQQLPHLSYLMPIGGANLSITQPNCSMLGIPLAGAKRFSFIAHSFHKEFNLIVGRIG